MSTSISAVVGDLPCFPTFYFYDPKFNLKCLSFLYTCLLAFCNIVMTGEIAHTTSKGMMVPQQGSAHTGRQWFKATSTSKNRPVPS